MNGPLTILQGDVLARLAEMPDESVQCVVTSPPYWGLRDYGVAGQLGLEPTPQEFIERMTDVFREVRRVLRADGTCWVNMGDSYAGSWGAQSRPNGSDLGSTLQGGSTLSARQIKAHPKGTHTGSLKNTPGLKPKDLCGIPWRLAFALQAAGWWLRRDIIWSKPNPMPESVTDRPASAHEYLFLLTKSERYYYDHEAVRENIAPSQVGRVRDDVIGGTSHKERGQHSEGGRYKTDKQRGHGRRHAGFNDRWDRMEKAEQCAGGRNCRSVWTIATQPFPEAHFATFPEEIPRRCILAGTREGDLVLDPFLGSGTTALVALQLRRRAVGIELNPSYADMARRRCEPIVNQGDLFREVFA